jgi:hypothetical protein
MNYGPIKTKIYIRNNFNFSTTNQNGFNDVHNGNKTESMVQLLHDL